MTDIQLCPLTNANLDEVESIQIWETTVSTTDKGSVITYLENIGANIDHVLIDESGDSVRFEMTIAQEASDDLLKDLLANGWENEEYDEDEEMSEISKHCMEEYIKSQTDEYLAKNPLEVKILMNSEGLSVETKARLERLIK